MKSIFVFVILVYGVFDALTDEMKTVMEGDSVTLNTDLTELQTDYKIYWYFGPEDSSILLAQIEGEKPQNLPDIFKDRLQIDPKTGDLTIMYMRHKHSGSYRAVIDKGKEGMAPPMRFTVTVHYDPRVINPAADEVKSVSVKEGESVTLHTDVTELQKHDLIVWRFGDEGLLIAKDDKEDNKSPEYDDVPDKRFSGKLQMDNKTGDLIISSTTTQHNGVYKVKISSKEKKHKTFNVEVVQHIIISEQGLSPGHKAAIVCVPVAIIVGVIVGAVIWSRRRVSSLEKQMVQEEKVKKGESVTLKSWVTELKSGDEIELSFKDTVIFIVIKEDKVEFLSNAMVKGRLRVDVQTGSLIIRNMRKEDAGLYKVKISSSSRVKSFLQFIRGGGPSLSQFNVIVYEEKLVMYESSVTLQPHTAIQSDDQIEWMFGDEVITKGNSSGSEYVCDDERFSGKLELQNETGSLTIENVNSDVTGFYKVKITRGKETSYCLFKVITEEIQTVTEGESVTLTTGLYKLPKDTEIKWMFKDEVIITGGTKVKKTFSTYDGNDERFKDRLELDNINGYLAIRDIEISNKGLYKVNITTGKETSVLQYQVDVLDVMNFAWLLDSGETSGKYSQSSVGRWMKPETETTSSERPFLSFDDDNVV